MNSIKLLAAVFAILLVGATAYGMVAAVTITPSATSLPALNSATLTIFSQAVQPNLMSSLKLYKNGALYYTWSDCSKITCTRAKIISESKGTYQYYAIGKDNVGSTLTSSTVTIIFMNNAPVAEANGPYSNDEGLGIDFTASGTTDRDGLNDIVSYGWDFGDGTTAVGATTTHTYADNGTYTATLTVTDADGAQSSDTAMVTIADVDPTADFTVSSADYNEGSTVTFDASASTGHASDAIADYVWDFGDDTTVVTTADSATDYVFADDGTYIVKLTVWDEDSSVSTTQSIVIYNAAPVLDAVGDRTVDENVTLEIQLFATDAGSDSLSYHMSPVIVGTLGIVTGLFTWTPDYDASGSYVITFSVDDGDGGTDSETITITVVNVNRAPVMSDVDVSMSEDVPTTIDLNDGYASDPDGDALTFSVTENAVNLDCSIDGNQLTITPIADWYGSESCTITVSDGYLTDSANFNITVDSVNDAPIAVIVSPVDDTEFVENTTVSFDASTSTDIDDGISSYAWNFGDGQTGSGSTATNTYAQNGTYTVTLNVTDVGGLSDVVTIDVIITDTSPTASFDASTTTPAEGETVTFASTSTGYDQPLSYIWDFGDGETSDLAHHIYADNGTYTVTLTVTDADGSQSTATAVMTVSDVSPIALFTVDPATPKEGQTVTFDASGSTDYATDVIVSYNWDFGDGESATTETPVVTYVYHDDGDFDVSLTVNDEDDSDAMTQTVSVTNVAPVLAAIGDKNVGEGATLIIQLNAVDAGTADVLTYSTNSTFGTFDTATGLFTWTPAYGDAGTYSVNFGVSDDDGAQDAEIITITVSDVNREPQLSIADQTTPEDTPLTVNVSTYAFDPDGDSLTFTVTDENASEVDCLIVGEQLTMTPVANWNGIARCTIGASDGDLTDTNEFSIIVTSVNDVPILVSAIPDVSLDEDGTYTFDITDYFSDIDSDLSYSYSSNDTDVVVAFDGSNATISASANWNGPAEVTLTASDGEHNVSDTFIVTVNPVPDYSVNIVSNAYYRQIDLSDYSTVYTITITNIGDVADSYDLSVENLDDADLASLNETVTPILAPSESYSVALSVGDVVTGIYRVAVTAIDGSADGTLTITTNIVTLDTGWARDSTVNGTYYVEQSTGLWANIDDSDIDGSVIMASAGGDFSVDISIVDSDIEDTVVENSWLNGVDATDSYINSSILTNCTIINATVKGITASNCYLADGVYDPPATNNMTGSIVTGSNTYQSNVTYSNVTGSNITTSNINNSVIDGSTIECSTIYDSVTQTSTVYCSIVNRSQIIDSELTNSTVQRSNVTDSVLIRSNVTDSEVLSSELVDTVVESSHLTNVYATNSVITRTTLSDATLIDANVTDGVLYSGVITIGNMTYNATGGLPLNLSDPSTWPAVNLSYSPSTISVGTIVTFNATISGQLDTSTTLAYTWDFNGDGSTDATTTDNATLNYSTTTTSYASAGTYNARVTATDGNGNYAWKIVSLTIASANPSGGSSGSSGSSGGGDVSSSSTVLQDRAKQTWTGLSPAVRYKATIDRKDIAFTSIAFTVTESVSGASEMTVTRIFNTTLKGITKSYQYVEVNSTFGSKAKDIEISFKVNRTWLAENNLSKDDVKLAVYRNGAWEYLNTTQVGEDNTYAKYIAQSPSFGMFAIAFAKSAPPVAEQPVTPIREEPGKIFVSEMQAGIATIVPINISGLAVTELAIKPAIQLTNVTISIKLVNSSYADSVAMILVTARQYFDMDAIVNGEVVSDEDIESVKVTFRMNKADMKEQKLDTSSMGLNRWVDGWKQLTTQKVSESDAYVTYSATSPGFSMYAIAAGTTMHPALIAGIAAVVVIIIIVVLWVIISSRKSKHKEQMRDGGEPVTDVCLAPSSELYRADQ